MADDKHPRLCYAANDFSGGGPVIKIVNGEVSKYDDRIVISQRLTRDQIINLIRELARALRGD